jgi:hypothetical protein
LIGCVLAAVVPLAHIRPAVRSSVSAFPGWPAELAGRTLTQLSLSEREQAFAEGFPGKLARFTDGSREIIIRWVTQETRRLHSAADCFKGLGYTIHPLPVQRDEAGQLWGSFEAQRGAERWRVSERIYEVAGTAGWTDVSTWYWQAVLGRTQGAWWAVTVAEPDLRHSR